MHLYDFEEPMGGWFPYYPVVRIVPEKGHISFGDIHTCLYLMQRYYFSLSVTQ